MVASADSPGRYRLVGVAVAVIGAVAVIYWQSFSRMVQMWELGTYQHGWLVLPIVLYVLWRERHRLASVRVGASWIGLSATGLLVLGWMMASALNVQAAEFLLATLLVPAAFWAVAGSEAARRAAFPLLLLLFAVPTGEFLVGPLMQVTADISTGLLYLVGVPAYREGMFITLPGGNFEVARVCAGLRYLLAGLMVSLAFSYVSYSGWPKRTAFVAVAAVTLVFANGLRAFGIMFVASATEMRWLTGDDHIYFGMAVFGAVLLVLIWLGDRYSDTQPRDDRISAAPSGQEGRAMPPIGMALMTLAVLAVGPVSQAVTREVAPGDAQRLGLPVFADCAAPGEWRANWQPRFKGADQTLAASYDCGSHAAHVWMAAYANQEQGKELISSVNRVWPKNRRRGVDQRRRSLELPGRTVTVQELRVAEPGGERLVWYWYRIGDLTTGDPLAVKAAEALDVLRLRESWSSVVVVAVESREASAGLESRLRDKAGAVLSRSDRAGAD